jgi:hypothetical protein
MPGTARSPRPEIGERTAPPDGGKGLSAFAQTARHPDAVPEAAGRARSEPTSDGNTGTREASPETVGIGHRPRSPAEPIIGRLAERLGTDERPGPVRVSIDTITIDAQSPPAQTRRSPRAAPKVSLEAYARRHKAPDR